MKKILADIKKLGVRVALDDFGTGYSSLNHIREMPIDVIKIDKCFVEDVGEDVFSEAFVKSVSQLADALLLISERMIFPMLLLKWWRNWHPPLMSMSV